MTGTKFGCGMALCGACTVHQDGNAIRFCITMIDSVGESGNTTIEPIDKTPAFRSHVYYFGEWTATIDYCVRLNWQPDTSMRRIHNCGATDQSVCVKGRCGRRF